MFNVVSEFSLNSNSTILLGRLIVGIEYADFTLLYGLFKSPLILKAFTITKL